MRPFPFLLLLFPLLAAGFPSVRTSSADIGLLARQLAHIRGLLTPRPPQQMVAEAFRTRRTPVRMGKTLLVWRNNALSTVITPGVWLVLPSADRLVLSDGSFVYTEAVSGESRFCTLTEGPRRWQGTFPGKSTVPAAESLTVGDGTVITRSHRIGEYALTLTDKHGYGYRICGNGVISFTKLTTGSLFSRLDWLQGRGAGLLEAAAGDFPGNPVSRVLAAWRDKNGDFGDSDRLAAFTLTFFRRAAGLGPVTPDAPLSRAAAAHAGYLAANRQNGRHHPPHTEYRDGYGFTGETVADRVRLAGNRSTSTATVAQLVGYEGNPVSCIAAWLAGIHHRRILLDPAAARIGFGSAIFAYSDSSGAGVAVLGFAGAPGAPVPRRWPGALPLWPRWDGREEPRLLDPARGPFGTPFSLYASKGASALPGALEFRFPGERHFVPRHPLGWGVRIPWTPGAAATTVPYPPAFALLDSLHPRAAK